MRHEKGIHHRGGMEADAHALGDGLRGSRIALMYDSDVFGRTAGQVVKILPLEK
jgi:hypothetical protein